MVPEKAIYKSDYHSNQNLALSHIRKLQEMSKVLAYDLQIVSAKGPPPEKLRKEITQSVYLVNSIW